jgi:hypothetical protein
MVTIPISSRKDEALRRVKPALSNASSTFTALTVEEKVCPGDRMSFRLRGWAKRDRTILPERLEPGMSEYLS